MAYLQLLRTPNLVIVALTQALIYACWLLPIQTELGIPLALDPFHFGLLILCTICITASGNIINDIFDQVTDQQNPGKKAIVGVQISEASARMYYWLVVALGFGLAVYLAIQTNNLPWLLLYPAAIALLWIYSRRLKCRPLLGNLLVSLFCALVIAIVWFAERHTFSALALKAPDAHAFLVRLLEFYMALAFSTTLFRELAKDVEDIPGDMKAGCLTFAVKYGPEASKRFLFGVGLLVIGLSFISMGHSSEVNKLILFSPVWILVLICLYLVVKARETDHFKSVSKLARLLILAGLLLYPLLNQL
ncbi:MAG: geranylgeranylglycerol-phosphate geranylgeranyltransferase [Saprospiraceae bacterium]|nr:geranylgeranylglycerol-phosphate geranylgeranyltransferase [Saprospiraceae bacterium]